jgi:glycosyltransferase involved in cell wall biosynthesis
MIGESSDSEIAGGIQSSTGIILPIWEGGGSNLKTAQALVSGKYILSTNYAFRGYEQFASTESLLLTDDEKSFVKEMNSPRCSTKNVNRIGVEVLEWKSILKDLPNTLKREYLRKNNLPNITKKIYFDITSLYNLRGQISGITRVIKSIRPCLEYLLDDFTYIIYDEGNRAFFKYDYKSSTIHERVYNLGKDNLFLSFTDSWNLEGYFNSLDHLLQRKNELVVLLYDCIPIVLPHSFGPGFEEIYTKWLNKAIDCTNSIITISNSSKNDLLKFILNQELAQNFSTNIIRLGDLFETNDELVLQNELSIDTSFILCVGTVEFRKNHQVILDAYRILISEGKRKLPKVVIAGKQGWMDNNISHQIHNDPRLKDNFVLFNNLSDRQVKYLYEECLFTMYPSFYEGWGLPVAESFACGKACILSNVSSLPEINSEVSIFCDPHDPYSWAEEIWKLVSDHKYLLSKENKVINHFTRQNWINTASEIISKLE